MHSYAHYVRITLLGIMGVILGVVGVAWYQGNYPFKISARDVIFGIRTNTLAERACVPNAANEEIYFISCGGIY